MIGPYLVIKKDTKAALHVEGLLIQSATYAEGLRAASETENPEEWEVLSLMDWINVVRGKVDVEEGGVEEDE